MTDHGRHIVVFTSFDRTVTLTTQALRDAGFTSLRGIDVRSVIRESGQELRQYSLITALHPSLMYRALQHDLDVGTDFLVRLAVYELADGETVVSTEEPLAMEMASRAWRGEHPQLAALAASLAEAVGDALATITRKGAGLAA